MSQKRVLVASGTYRNRTLRHRTIEFDGDKPPRTVTDPDGAVYAFEHVSRGDLVYIPEEWLNDDENEADDE